MVRRRSSAGRKLIGLIMTVGGIAGGGYMDMANNTQTPSTEGSNTDVVAEYNTQIESLAELRGDTTALSQKGAEFLGSVYTNTQLSESDVASLTDLFSAKVAPPATLAGGYVLEHPEYLDECKSDMSMRSLGALDQCTLNKHKEAYDDGPWLGMFAGWLAVNMFGGLAVGIIFLTGLVAGKGILATADGVGKLGKKISKPKRPKHGPH